MSIDRVATAIADLLRVPVASAPGSPVVSVTIGAPNTVPAASDLILFLYLITPDAEQRNQERVRPFPNAVDPPQVVAPSIPLELRFLVTLGTQPNGSAQPFGRLAHAIRIIEAASPLSVPSAFQQAVWLSLLPMDTDELSRIWGLFPNENCRSSFAFRAAPVWIDPLVVEPVAGPVLTDSMTSSRLPEGV